MINTKPFLIAVLITHNGLCMSSKGLKSTKLSIPYLAKSLIWFLPYYFFKSQIKDLAELINGTNFQI